MSINIVKGVEFGLGFEQTRRFGSAVHDVIEGRGEGGRWIHRTNNAGGLTGGVTNGEPLVVRGAVKPISTLARPLPSADLADRRGGRQGPLRAVRHQRRPGRRRRRRGDGDADVLADSMLDKFGGDRRLAEVGATTSSSADAGLAIAAPRRRRARGRDRRVGRGRRPAPAATTEWSAEVDVVLVGLPGSGKSAVGRRLAHRHGAAFVDLDESDRERRRPARSRRSSRTDGEAAFRALERAAVDRLGPADPDPAVRRVIATGGGAVVDPRNRWALYRRRLPIWLDGRPEVLAQRLRRSPERPAARPGRDPIGTIRELGRDRAAVLRGGRAAQQRDREVAARRRTRRRARGGTGARRPDGTVLAAGGRRLGPISSSARASRRSRSRRRCGGPSARRAILVSEPGAWAAAGERLAGALAADGFVVERVMLPQGEDAKRLAVDRGRRARARATPRRARRAARRGRRRRAGRRGRVPRRDLAARRPGHPRPDDARRPDRFVDRRQDRRSTCPRARTSSGRSTSRRRSSSTSRSCGRCPERQRRAALGEAVKMAALGDERLFELLERDGDGDRPRRRGGLRIRRGRRARRAGGLGEGRGRHGRRARAGARAAAGSRSTWATRSGHAFEAVGRLRRALLHGEAVAYGLRAACRIGVESWASRRPDRRSRIEALLDAPGAGDVAAPLPARRGDGGPGDRQEARRRRLRWVLPTADGYEVRSDVPSTSSSAVVGGLLASRLAAAASAGVDDPRPRPPGPEPEPARHARAGDLRPRHRSTTSTPRSPRAPPSSGLDVDFFQSNHEGALIDRLHERDFDAAIVNAGGLTHTSVALRDALLAVERPFWEVHLSDPATREPFRQVNFLARRRAGLDRRPGQARLPASRSRRSPRSGWPVADRDAPSCAGSGGRIDALDRRIVAPAQRARRAGAATSGREKVASGRRAVRDAEREREVLLRVTMANAGPMPQADLLAIYRRLIAVTRGLETRDRARARRNGGSDPA